MQLIEYSAEKLQQMRQEKGWSLRSAAEVSGIPFTSWARFEKGVAPDLFRLRQLSKAFGVRFV